MTREEFEQLVMNTGPDIYAFCLQLTRNREEAEELYQETMLAAMERHKKIDSLQNPKSYMLGIAIGLWKNLRRRIARRNRILPKTSLDAQLEEVYPTESTQSLEEEILEGELQRVVRRMAEELPEKYRLVVYLYYSRQQKIEEIASMLHIPKGTVKSRLHKARGMMKDRMEAEGYEISER